jgi:hypothetical protein
MGDKIMFEHYLIVMALTSGCLSISAVGSTSRVMKLSLFGGISLLADGCKSRWQQLAATHLIGVLWVLYYIYHYMIFKLFPGEVLLNIVNLVAVVLSSAGLIRDMYHLATGQSSQNLTCYNELLVVAGSYWEVILAGVVLLELVLNQVGLR